MTQQSRMLLLVVIVSVGSVALLMALAQRYNGILEQQANSRTYTADRVTDALRTVDDFIRVRQTLRQIIEAEATGGSGRTSEQVAQRLLAGRQAALAGMAMSAVEYTRTRRQYRLWKAESEELSPNFAEAFERRRVALEAIDLGAFESHDL